MGVLRLRSLAASCCWVVVLTAMAATQPAAGAAAQPSPGRTAPLRMTLGVPAYFYPGPTWSQAVAGVPALRYLIANPASGPGEHADPAYADVVRSSRLQGVEVLGYVSTRWGTRPVEQVLEDVMRYRRWYGVSSVFLDEAATSPSAVPYYRRVAETVRTVAGARVALNPGTIPDEAYVELADLVVVFEGSYAAYRSWRPPAWQRDHPRAKFWHLVYDTPADRLAQVLRTADRRRAGVVYVTDDVLDNPWDRLPSYWPEALRGVHALERRRPGPPWR